MKSKTQAQQRKYWLFNPELNTVNERLSTNIFKLQVDNVILGRLETANKP